jgi:hypothetical protein
MTATRAPVGLDDHAHAVPELVLGRVACGKARARGQREREQREDQMLEGCHADALRRQ